MNMFATLLLDLFESGKVCEKGARFINPIPSYGYAITYLVFNLIIKFNSSESSSENKQIHPHHHALSEHKRKPC